MSRLHFKEWLVTESQNPKILLPYINHRKDQRLSRGHKHAIQDDHLKMDYEESMKRLYDIFAHEHTVPVMLRKATRCYEIARDRMHEKARREHNYMMSYSDTEPDNDLWMFVRALEDISNGSSPNLEELL